jgi:hypothetical protein
MPSILDKKRFLGSLAGRMLLLFGRKQKSTDKDALKTEFKTSTHRLGVRFSEKIRSVFRHRWVRQDSKQDQELKT